MSKPVEFILIISNPIFLDSNILPIIFQAFSEKKKTIHTRGTTATTTSKDDDESNQIAKRCLLAGRSSSFESANKPFSRTQSSIMT